MQLPVFLQLLSCMPGMSNTAYLSQHVCYSLLGSSRMLTLLVSHAWTVPSESDRDSVRNDKHSGVLLCADNEHRGQLVWIMLLVYMLADVCSGRV